MFLPGVLVRIADGYLIYLFLWSVADEHLLSYVTECQEALFRSELPQIASIGEWVYEFHFGNCLPTLWQLASRITKETEKEHKKEIVT